MASVLSVPTRRNKRPLQTKMARCSQPAEVQSDSRYGRRLTEILSHAAEVFCEKGYAVASMRDLSRATGMSLAGLYYYFESKEELLYEIQKHAFETILVRLREQLRDANGAEQRVRVLIRNHLEYFLANQNEMKVLSHEAGMLAGEWDDNIRTIKRQYYELCRELVEALKAEHGVSFSSRLAVLSLFGMMNWIYTWHNPGIDGGAEELSQGMADLFLRGLLDGRGPKRESAAPTNAPRPAARKRPTASPRS